MEAYQEKDVKRDSFEEVDRILAIVEESKKKFDNEETVYNLFLRVLYIAMVVVLSGTTILVYNGTLNKVIGLITLIIPVFILCVIEIIYTPKIKKKVRHEFEQTRDQATEVIREIVPALSRSERWSTLRKFELRLRLSRLGISADTIFEREFDLP